MCITVNDVIGEKRIDLAYPIKRKEVAVVIMVSDNVQYLLKEPVKVLLKMGKNVELSKGVYMDKELDELIGFEKVWISHSEYALRVNKLEHVTEMTIDLDELDNTDNFKDGRPAMSYLHIMCLLLKILYILNPTSHNTGNLRWYDYFFDTENNGSKW